MRIIALMNQKGGVGKTTTTANLGAALAEQGQRVCLIDLDPQAHLTINYGVEPTADVISLYDVLIDDRSFLEAVHKIDDRIALVPSSIDLAGAEIELVSVIGRETLLKKKLEDTQHDFDFILIDCPPSLGLLTINALSVAHEVIIPMQPHFLALQGVAKLLETIHLVNKRMNPQLKVAGVVLTMYDAQTKLSSEVVAELHRFIEEAHGKPLPWAGAKVFQTKIRRNIKLAECPSFGQTILKYDPASNGAFDYRNLARELLGLPPLVAPVARPVVKTVAVQQVPPGATMPPKPVMPPALVAAMKAQALKKPAAVAPQTRPVAVVPVKDQSPLAVAPAKMQAPVETEPAKTQAAAAPPVAAVPAAQKLLAATAPGPFPVPSVPTAPRPATPSTHVVSPAPLRAPTSAPSAAPRPATPAPPAKPVTVVVAPAIDQAKLAASNPPPAPADQAEQEVA